MWYKILSYLWPITRKTRSDYNGLLEVTWYNGKKLLDSAHTNYSYGNLQEVLAFGLNHIDIKYDEPALILGLGGGSVIDTLRKGFSYVGHITAVDFDHRIIALANHEFGIGQSPNLMIKCQDAESFVKQCNAHFGLVVVDLFIDDKVPDKFYQTDFWLMLHKRLTPDASVLFNAGVTEKSELFVAQLKTQLSEHWVIAQLHLPDKANQLLILRRK